jgi:hypothetical protein
MKVAVPVVVLAFISTCIPALAQFESLQFAICKKVIAESDRLKCYDAIGTKPRAVSDEPTPVKGKWVYTESKSPIDDSDQVLAVLAGEPEDALLVFRCMEKRSEAVFVPPLGFFATGRANVLVGIDGGTADTITTSVGTNNRALFISPAPEFMRLLTDNGKLFLRASGYQGKQADGLFNLADVSVARDKVAETCHWSTPKDDRASAAVAGVPVAKPKPKVPTPSTPMKLN